MRWNSSICLSFSASGKAILRRLHFIEKLAPQPLSLGFVPENRFGQLVWDFRARTGRRSLANAGDVLLDSGPGLFPAQPGKAAVGRGALLVATRPGLVLLEVRLVVLCLLVHSA